MNKKDFNKRFGAKIKRLRKAKGLSQEELAEKIDKTVETISSTERGITVPRIDNTMLIAKVLDVPLHELFEINELPARDREKRELLEEIHDLLKTQTTDFLRTSLEQIKQLIVFQESTTKRK